MAFTFLSRFLGGKHADEWAYQTAADEVSSGVIRQGLMAKAVAHAEGDQSKRQALYLRYVAEQILAEGASEKLKQGFTAGVALAHSQSELVKTTSAPIARAFFDWVRAVASNLAAGLVLALPFGIFLAYLQLGYQTDFMSYVSSNMFSWFSWGVVLAGTLIVALIIWSAIAALMFFQFFRRENGVAFIIALIPVFFFLTDQWKGQQALERYRGSSSAPVVAITYDQALAAYEQRYPQLNPDTPRFDRALTDSVSVRVQHYVAAGRSKTESLDLAIADIMVRGSGAVGVSPTAQR